jgi:4-amino-4-deoxy-L-arabinose transferase-like glycosyltransferase
MPSLAIKRSLFNTAIIPAVITVFCLVPFANKAFHMDDPMYIWAAKHIQNNPVDFYGFTVNWDKTERPMAEVNKNPPLVSFYIALVAWLFGFSEIALHLAFLIPAVAVALGTYYLARLFCLQPVVAALAAVLTPVFLVSSTNIMSDTMMLAFWVWAMVLWIRGLKNNHWLFLLSAGVLLAICALTKYFGIALIPLLFIYSLAKKRKLGYWILFLSIPVIILTGYQWATHVLYGRGLLLDAASYATESRWGQGPILFSKGVTGLAFTGGCVITALFYAPLLWSRRILIDAIILTIMFILAVSLTEKTGSFKVYELYSIPSWSFLIQFGLMSMAGASILGLAGADFWKCRDADSLLLLLWVFGTVFFAAFINWTINARSILPMVPAVGILLIRRIDRRIEARQLKNIRLALWPLIPAAFVALLVCLADYTWAGTARDAAVALEKKYAQSRATVWFLGHWGFQYYMEAGDGRVMDLEKLKIEHGDIIILPLNNCYSRLPSKKSVRFAGVWAFTGFRRLATMNFSLGAGFYSDLWGPLPFATGRVTPDKYYVYITEQNIDTAISLY